MHAITMHLFGFLDCNLFFLPLAQLTSYRKYAEDTGIVKMPTIILDKTRYQLSFSTQKESGSEFQEKIEQMINTVQFLVAQKCESCKVDNKMMGSWSSSPGLAGILLESFLVLWL